MAMDLGGPRCAKYTLYVVNVVIIILACVTLGVGIWLSTNVSSFVTALNPQLDPTHGLATESFRNHVGGGVSRLQTVANVLITAGVFALLIGILGFWAAYKESKSLLITYGVILILVVLLELGAGIAFAVDKPTIIHNVARDFAMSVDNYDYVKTGLDSNDRIVILQDRTNNNITEQATLMLNVLQTWVGCCGGLHGYRDFGNAPSPYWKKSGGVPPVFCCKLVSTKTLQLEDPGCIKVRTEENSWMNTGCADKTADIMRKNMPSVIGVSVGVGIVDIIGVVAAFYFYYTLSHGYREF
ncbi:tetraspanin-1-like isoform X1 [Paramacrobiotus metropolitanus]|uniref:tetraspanin-1-like isoform X1 n=1 Tax=Paramacrobiotus metropolitanus TaxID=2943436 RepID=UPI0024456FCC|nr:tetraspanin-1-like isoform X1 [Paramacrobiotus metropolitanus]